jgi:thymidine phosphorylase
MDVKVGTGAFSRDRDEARALAESLVTVATGAGLPTRALVTDQNEVLGRTAGNAVEVREAVALLTRTADLPRFEALVRALCANLLVMGGLEPDGGAAAARVTRALDDGSAAERFARMVAALSGDADVLEHPDRVLPAAPCVRPLLPSRAGTVRRIDGRRIGMTIVEMGGGRRRADDTIDPAVGLSAVLGLGERTGPDRPLALVHARSESQFLEAARAFDAAFEVGDEPLEPGPVVLETIGAPS